jgi:hypothetical protein
VTNRKVASLTSGLLARKGAARPAEPSAEDTGSTAPASADSADQIASSRDSVDSPGEAKRDYRAYAWPNQGAPVEEELAMSAPPSPADVEQAMAAVRRGDRIRRLAISGIAAAVVAGLVVIVVKDGRKDEARIAAPTAPAAVTATPSAAPAETPPSALAANAPAPAAPSAPPESAARRATADVPREIRDVAPSSGSPLPPRADMELAPRIPPVPTQQMAAIAKAPSEPSPIDAATLAPPPVKRPREDATVPQPKPRPAAKRPVEPATAAAGNYAVQIASIGSKERAAAERTRLSRHLAPLLGGRALVIERATVAGYGTVYRIRAPGYANLAAARKACTQIKSRGLGCLVVRL